MALSSTIFGSISIIFKSVGVALYSRLTRIELMQTDLPEPVAPAIIPCGILRKSIVTGSPVKLSLSTASSGEVEVLKFFGINYFRYSNWSRFSVRNFNTY